MSSTTRRAARLYEASFAGSVAILAWPEEAEEAAACARTGQPRLLLVAARRRTAGRLGRVHRLGALAGRRP